MYPFKAINMSVPEDIFDEICFLAVSDVRMKNKNNDYIPTEYKQGIFICNSKDKDINLSIANSIMKYLNRRNYRVGENYTINIFIEN